MIGTAGITSTGIFGAEWRYSGLEGRDRAIVAALVRYHNRKSEPAAHHARTQH